MSTYAAGHVTPPEIVAIKAANKKFNEAHGLGPVDFGHEPDISDVVSVLDRIAVALERLAFGVVTDAS